MVAVVWLTLGIVFAGLSATPGLRALRFAGEGLWFASIFEIARGVLSLAAAVVCILIATGRLA